MNRWLGFRQGSGGGAGEAGGVAMMEQGTGMAALVHCAGEQRRGHSVSRARRLRVWRCGSVKARARSSGMSAG